MAAPVIGYVPVQTRGAASIQTAKMGVVTPGNQNIITSNAAADYNTVTANMRPQDFGERTKNNGPDPLKGDGGY